MPNEPIENVPNAISARDMSMLEGIKQAESEQEKHRVQDTAGGKLDLMKEILGAKQATNPAERELAKARVLSAVDAHIDANVGAEPDGNDVTENQPDAKTKRAERVKFWQDTRGWLRDFLDSSKQSEQVQAAGEPVSQDVLPLPAKQQNPLAIREDEPEQSNKAA